MATGQAVQQVSRLTIDEVVIDGLLSKVVMDVALIESRSDVTLEGIGRISETLVDVVDIRLVEMEQYLDGELRRLWKREDFDVLDEADIYTIVEACGGTCELLRKLI